jgi:broad specificity phosphatase PhoE
MFKKHFGQVFYLVRHAESDNNKRSHDDSRSGAEEYSAPESPTPATQSAPKPKKTTREPDPCVTEKGHAQARCVAEFLRSIMRDEELQPKFKPDRVYTSGMRRTLQTSRAIVDKTNLPVTLHVPLHEDGGVFFGARRDRPSEDAFELTHGLTYPEMQQIVPTLQASESDFNHPNGGWWPGRMETEQQSLDRAEAVKEWMLNTNFMRSSYFLMQGKMFYLSGSKLKISFH